MTTSKPKRRPELDALRGLFLILMVMAHLPTVLSDWANQPIGFISAAEGFVGLSAMLTGLIYYRKLMQDESAVWRKLWRRSLRIYFYQLILLALLFTIAAAIAVDAHRVAILNLLTYFIAYPVRAAVAAAALIYCPPLFDILPMYIIFLFLTPPLLSLARRIGWNWILASSAALWVAAQFGLRQTVDLWISGVLHLHMPIPANGAFDLFAWQTVWIVGLWFGAKFAVEEFPLRRLPRWTLPVSIAVCAVFLGIRHGWFGPDWGQQSFGVLLDKWQLGSLRVINIASYIVLFWWIRKAIGKAITHEPLIMFGQASIEVFCWHLFFVFIGLALVTGDLLHISGPAALTLDIITLPALFLMALYIRRRRQRRPPQDREAKPIILSTQPAGQPKPRENATPVLAVSPVAENDDAA
ncbi:MAG TPA: OpgC domain-containing protein [Acidobacteriaceae bacterium]|nr:OpgC domain-containing protein [Acidobacteriaceae bacterium]